MNPDDEWQKWHEKETQRLEEQQRCASAVLKAVAITVVIVTLIETFLPGFMYLPLFALGWTTAYNVSIARLSCAPMKVKRPQFVFERASEKVTYATCRATTCEFLWLKSFYGHEGSFICSIEEKTDGENRVNYIAAGLHDAQSPAFFWPQQFLRYVVRAAEVCAEKWTATAPLSCYRCRSFRVYTRKILKCKILVLGDSRTVVAHQV
jgi:hypothetical protein